jgi:hypothetical protein
MIDDLKPQAAHITPEECEAMGGHCFVGTGFTYATNPPMYPQECKHCGKKRVGTPQENMRWTYPD